MAGLSRLGVDGAGTAPGLTVSSTVRVVPPSEPVIVAAVAVVTDEVVTVKVLLVAPAGIDTFVGTAVVLELSESETNVPPLGAAALSVTVPVEELPPRTLLGLNVTEVSVGPIGGGVTLIGLFTIVPPN